MILQRNTTDIATKTTIESLGRKVTVYVADLSSSESVSVLVPRILKDGFRIDVLLNGAGIQ